MKDFEWYRKTPKWHFWDKTRYAKYRCPYKKCGYSIEIYKPTHSLYSVMGWRTQMASHLALDHQKKKKKAKK